MSTENKIVENSSPAKQSLNINLDYLVPTLSAIGAGLIHHICNKKEKLTYIDILLIISPSLPVLLGIMTKIIAFMINWIANGTQNMNLGFLGTFIQKINSYINFKQKVDNTHSYDEKGRIIFYKYTVDIDISKKMTEWQKEGYYANILKNIDMSNSYFSRIIFFYSGIMVDTTTANKNHFTNFYHEVTIQGNKVIMYFVNNKEDKYDLYFFSSSYDYTVAEKIFYCICPTKYTENKSYYRISRIYNEYREELLHTIRMYKEKSISRRKVCMNFCFAGPPGTSKTYGARAIAKELNRGIFEINLSKIVFEEEFLALFTEENIKNYIFLLDEIDLMCPSREFDDKLIKSAEETRLTTFGVSTTCNSTKSIENEESETSSLTEEDGYGNVNKRLLHKINLLQEDIRKLHEKMEKTSSFQEWLEEFLKESFKYVYFGCILSNSYYNSASGDDFIKIKDYFKFKTVNMTSCLNYYFTYMESNFSIQSKKNNSSKIKSQDKTPFTLRTLLNFISGGNTHDDLVMIATTNRHEKLDPALIRPGRLRLIEFKNLRKVDAIAMLLENYPEQRDAIERGLNEIGYEDYMSNGALLEAVMSSTSTLEKTLQSFQRELMLINN